jgi:hypothetical protein
MAKVTAPDGTSTQLPLSAVGAGLHSAAVPAARPGAYVASLVDEQTQTLEATTGAVLALGDELRPTGTDRGLLRRIAEQSGGKERDTLAGIFLDRDAERFGYTPLTPLLIYLAAFGLLFAIAARRLSAPEWLERAWAAFRAERPATATATAGAAGVAQESAVGALQRVRSRKARAEQDEPPPSVPRFSRPPPPPSPSAVTPPQGAPPIARPPASDTTPGAAPGATTRQPTAAEILLARRRGRKN